jgi:transposase
MHATTVAVDLAKNVFQVVAADAEWRPVESARLTRSQFQRWFDNRAVGQVILEACGTAHHWARWLGARGIRVRLLPPRYVRPYVKRNKTDAADAAALLEAARCADIRDARVKSIEQQALQAIHRVRSQRMSTRTARINMLRGTCREFGVDLGVGARVGVEQLGRVLADPQCVLPTVVLSSLRAVLEEIRLLELRIAQLEKELSALAQQSTACTTLLSVPGVGLLTATGGDVAHFQDAGS